MLRLNFPRVSVAGLGELTAQIIAKVEAANIAEIMEKDLFKQLKTLAADYQLSLGKKKNTEYTVQVANKDEERDNSLIGMKMTVEGALRNRDSKVLDAALRLQNVINIFAKGIEKLPYNDESQKIKTFLAEMKKPENQEAIKALNIAGWIKELEELQSEFDILVSSRQDNNAVIDSTLSATNQRKKLESACYDLLMTIWIAAEYKKTEEFKLLTNSLQKVLEDFSTPKRKKKPDSDEISEE